MDDLRESLRVLRGVGTEPRPCPSPGCQRRSIRNPIAPGRRHKRRPGGEWCDGKADPMYDRSLEALGRVHDALADAHMSGDYERVLVLAEPVLRMLGVPRG